MNEIEDFYRGSEPALTVWTFGSKLSVEFAEKRYNCFSNLDRKNVSGMSAAFGITLSATEVASDDSPGVGERTTVLLDRRFGEKIRSQNHVVISNQNPLPIVNIMVLFLDVHHLGIVGNRKFRRCWCLERLSSGQQIPVNL
jgi:hypothetical protein